MRDESRGELDRRGFMKLGLCAVAALPIAGALFGGRAARAAGDMVTDIEANKPILTSLQYVATSAKPDQSCASCQFYTAAEGGKGKCTLIPNGFVSEKGWCMSYAKKV